MERVTIQIGYLVRPEAVNLADNVPSMLQCFIVPQ